MYESMRWEPTCIQMSFTDFVQSETYLIGSKLFSSCCFVFALGTVPRRLMTAISKSPSSIVKNEFFILKALLKPSWKRRQLKNCKCYGNFADKHIDQFLYNLVKIISSFLISFLLPLLEVLHGKGLTHKRSRSIFKEVLFDYVKEHGTALQWVWLLWLK